jgi:hypothetical protein
LGDSDFGKKTHFHFSHAEIALVQTALRLPTFIKRPAAAEEENNRAARFFSTQ